MLHSKVMRGVVRFIMTGVFWSLLLAVGTQARTYTIGFVPSIASSILDVAQQQRFWKSQGLDVKLVRFETPQELSLALEKRLDFAFDLIGNGVGLYLDGVPIVVLGAAYWSSGYHKLIARSDIPDGALQGRRVGMYLRSPATLFFLDRYLHQKGKTLQDVTCVEIHPELLHSHFKAGKVDRKSVV